MGGPAPAEGLTGAVGRGALAGIRVIELAHVMAGPVCGRMLADMGADVVKVEPPGAGDPTRAFAPPEVGGTAAAFVMANRNKRGIVIDLKTDPGQEAARRMLARCDVVIENFRQGVMEDLGLGYESLRDANPGLVYCQITGFGRSGPLADRRGFDLIAQGMTGLLSVTGEGPGRPPVKCGPPLTDITAGILGAMGVVAALYARESTGKGQRVDTSLYEAGLIQTLWQAAVALATGESPGPLGSAHPLAAPYEALPTSDGWITVGGWNQVNWLRMIEVLKLRELAADPRFATNADRMANVEELRELLSRRLRTAAAETWLRRLEAANVPAGPVSGMIEALRHPQTVAREMVLTVSQAGQPVETLGMPVKMSGTPPAVGRGAPRRGEHGEQVLAEYGFRDVEIEELLRSGAVGRFKA
ncbi:MAG: CaiB/BaiF CoA-transferase family protein [Gemmatimonadota bacterium]|nr:CaiB/BaiF CoA-transferase family protein [Gemmatimonadota bacterium]